VELTKTKLKQLIEEQTQEKTLPVLIPGRSGMPSREFLDLDYGDYNYPLDISGTPRPTTNLERLVSTLFKYLNLGDENLGYTHTTHFEGQQKNNLKQIIKEEYQKLLQEDIPGYGRGESAVSSVATPPDERRRHTGALSSARAATNKKIADAVRKAAANIAASGVPNWFMEYFGEPQEEAVGEMVSAVDKSGREAYEAAGLPQTQGLTEPEKRLKASLSRAANAYADQFETGRDVEEELPFYLRGDEPFITKMERETTTPGEYELETRIAGADAIVQTLGVGLGAASLARMRTAARAAAAAGATEAEIAYVANEAAATAPKTTPVLASQSGEAISAELAKLQKKWPGVHPDDLVDLDFRYRQSRTPGTNEFNAAVSRELRRLKEAGDDAGATEYLRRAQNAERAARKAKAAGRPVQEVDLTNRGIGRSIQLRKPGPAPSERLEQTMRALAQEMEKVNPTILEDGSLGFRTWADQKKYKQLLKQIQHLHDIYQDMNE